MERGIALLVHLVSIDFSNPDSLTAHQNARCISEGRTLAKRCVRGL